MKKTIANIFTSTALAVLTAALLWVGAGSGCKTTTVVTDAGVTNTSSTLDPVAAGAAAEALAVAGSSFAVAKDKNSVGYLRASSLVLRAAANSGVYDPAAVQSALDKMTVNELKTAEVKACIVAVFALYKSVFATAVDSKLDAATWVKPVMLGIANGIDAVVGTSASPVSWQQIMPCATLAGR